MRETVRSVIFGTETFAGKLFDVALIGVIFVGLCVVSLESVDSIESNYGDTLRILEWVVTAIFTIEYLLRLWSAAHPAAYARSFFGVVDLLSILPTWAGLVFTGTQSLVVIRALRILRIFRVLKLAQFSREASQLARALRSSRPKIIVFVGSVLCAVIIVGALMHLIEGPENGFHSIPLAMYWAIVTMTTVGYGDIAPQTPVGQAMASVLMIMGYGVIAVPTGIVSAELVHASRDHHERRECLGCGARDHESDARHCKLCGRALPSGRETGS
ncbi:MAG: ion transporter [Planctomycetota bacterium]